MAVIKSHYVLPLYFLLLLLLLLLYSNANLRGN